MSCIYIRIVKCTCRYSERNEIPYHVQGAPFGDTFGGAKKDLDQGQTVVLENKFSSNLINWSNSDQKMLALSASKFMYYSCNLRNCESLFF